jgi:hypothetical protein
MKTLNQYGGLDFIRRLSGPITPAWINAGRRIFIIAGRRLCGQAGGLTTANQTVPVKQAGITNQCLKMAGHSQAGPPGRRAGGQADAGRRIGIEPAGGLGRRQSKCDCRTAGKKTKKCALKKHWIRSEKAAKNSARPQYDLAAAGRLAGFSGPKAGLI